MNASLTVLGCRACAPADYSAASGYLLEFDGKRVLLDSGPGIVQALANRNLIHSLDAVIVSHGHGDHCADVIALAYARSFPEPDKSIPLYGPTGIKPVIDGLDKLFGVPTMPIMTDPVRDRMPLYEIDPGSTFDVLGLRVETIAAKHPIPTLSFKFSDFGLVYTADTALTDDLQRLSRGAKVMLTEATYVTTEGKDVETHGHMGGKEVGVLSRNCDVESVILTHLTDWSDAGRTIAEVVKEYDGPLDLARPGMKLEL